MVKIIIQDEIGNKNIIILREKPGLYKILDIPEEMEGREVIAGAAITGKYKVAKFLPPDRTRDFMPVYLVTEVKPINLQDNNL